MKLVAKKAELALQDDPRPKDKATWQRLRLIVEHEACHPDWGCALYRLHRTGRIDNDQREAGDRYTTLVRDHRKIWRDKAGDVIAFRTGGHETLERRSELTYDVEIAMGHVLADALAPESEFEIARAKRIGRRYREASEVAGPARGILEAMLIDDTWPVGERGHIAICHALTRLFHFFSTGTKRKRNKICYNNKERQK